MNEAEWLRSADSWEMLWSIRDKVSPRKGDLFGSACCRRIWNLLTKECREQIRIIERHADEPSQPDVDAEECEAAFEKSRAAVPEKDRGRIDAVMRAVFLCWRQWEPVQDEGHPGELEERRAQTKLVLEVMGNPFRPVSLEPTWLRPTVIDLARSIYEERAFDRMSILGDALEEAGCDQPDILAHCQSEALHVRGCWVIDAILGKS